MIQKKRKSKDEKKTMKEAMVPVEGPVKEELPEIVEETVSDVTIDIVAPGKAITTRRGIKGPGSVITAALLNGGTKALAKLKAKGYIIAKR